MEKHKGHNIKRYCIIIEFSNIFDLFSIEANKNSIPGKTYNITFGSGGKQLVLKPINNIFRLSKKSKNNLIAYSFIFPNFICFFILVVLPMLFSIVMSFFDWRGGVVRGFVGFDHYMEMFENRVFLVSLKNTLFFALGLIPITMVSSLTLALALNRRLRGLGFFRALYFFPYVTPVVALGVVWNMLFNPDIGLVNQTISSLLGIPLAQLPRWTLSTAWSLPTIILAEIFRCTGYYMVIYLAGLQNIPKELYEAARVDGARSWQIFFNITLPSLAPVSFFIMIMLTVRAFRSFELVYVMTDGGPGLSSSVLAIHIYKTAFVNSRFGYSSAVSVILLLMVLIITRAQLLLTGGDDSV